MIHPDVWKTLSPNHRRAIGSLLTHLHHQLTEALHLALDETPSALDETVQDLSAQQKKIAVAGISELNKKLEETLKMAALQDSANKYPVGSLHAIETLLSFLLVNLDENDSARLKGYGELTPTQSKEIDDWVKELYGTIENLKGRLLSASSLKTAAPGA